MNPDQQESVTREASPSMCPCPNELTIYCPIVFVLFFTDEKKSVRSKDFPKEQQLEKET